MATVSTNEFKGGLKFMLDNEPCSIIDNEYVKPGKGQAFNRVKLRKLLSGKTLEKTFKSGESFELADVIDIDLDYLYSDGEFYHFMNSVTFEQIAADAKSVGDTAKCGIWFSYLFSVLLGVFSIQNTSLITHLEQKGARTNLARLRA